MKLKVFLSYCAVFTILVIPLSSQAFLSKGVKIDIKVSGPRAIIALGLNYYIGQEKPWETQWFNSNANGQVAIQKELPAELQIAYLTGPGNLKQDIPIFISQETGVVMAVQINSAKEQPIVKFNGTNGPLQSLPYQIQNFYSIPDHDLNNMDFAALKLALMKMDGQVNDLLRKSNIHKPAEVALLQRFAGILRMKIKYAYLNIYKGSVPDGFTSWYLQDENFKGKELGLICRQQSTHEYNLAIIKGKALLYPEQPEPGLWDLMLEDRNQILIKKEVIPTFYAHFKAKGITTEITKMYKRIRQAVDSRAQIAELDKFYKVYEELTPGRIAADFTLKDANGKDVRLSDFRGKMLVIDCWGTWCSGCLKLLPTFREFAASYKDSTDIAFMTIALESQGDGTWREYLKEHDMEQEVNLILMRDSEQDKFFRNVYRMLSYPRYMVIDREGKFLDAHLENPDKKGFSEKITQWYKEKR